MLGLLRRLLPASAPQPAPLADLPDLSWVDEWVANVKDYIAVREEDDLFIQRPNKAFKLNPQGIELITNDGNTEGVIDTVISACRVANDALNNVCPLGVNVADAQCVNTNIVGNHFTRIGSSLAPQDKISDSGTGTNIAAPP